MRAQNPVSAISLLAPFVVHTRTSHSNLYGKRGNGACTLSREETTATAIDASPVGLPTHFTELLGLVCDTGVFTAVVAIALGRFR